MAKPSGHFRRIHLSKVLGQNQQKSSSKVAVGASLPNALKSTVPTYIPQLWHSTLAHYSD